MPFDLQSKHSTLAKVALSLGGWSARRAGWVLGVLFFATAALAPLLPHLGYDDDVIQFLPEGDPEVDRFRTIGERFLGLSVALVGVESHGPVEGGVFAAERAQALRELSLAMRQLPGVAFATSFTELRDVVEARSDDGEVMAVVSDLVGEIPATPSPEWSASLRERVLSRAHVAGSLVSHDGQAAMALAYLAPDARQREAATAIRETCQRLNAEAGHPFKLYFGGAPFIGAYVADGAERDLAELSPWVALAIVLIVLVTARSLVGALAALASVGVGIVFLLAAMVLAGRPLTLVSSSLPVLLVALGSAYSIHLLTRALHHLDQGAASRRDAALTAVQEVAPPIFAAGLTTALGFLSFLVMDIRPMREFGLWMSAGTFLVVLLALLVVPAAFVLLPLKARAGGRVPAWAATALGWLATAATRHPWVTTGVGFAIIAAGSVGSGLVETHMETRRFFAEGSEPVVAEDFLERNLGGSLFLQIELKGPLKEPLALRQVERLAQLAASLDGVRGVQAVTDVIVLAGGAMTGEPRIPHSTKTSRAVAALVDDDPNLRLLVDASWEHALVQVKLGGFDTRRASELAAQISDGTRQYISGPRRALDRAQLTQLERETELQEVAQHVKWVLAAASVGGKGEAKAHVAAEQIAEALRSPVHTDTARSQVRAALTRAIEEDEVVYLSEGADLQEFSSWLAEQLAAGQTVPMDSLLAQLSPLVTEEERADTEGLTAAGQNLLDTARAELALILKKERAERVLALVGAPLAEADVAKVQRAVAPLGDPWASVAGAAPNAVQIDVAVSGYPMVYAGMNKSVYLNQTFSLLVASALVFLALAWFFRSARLAFATALPAALTLLVVFGIMGFGGIPVDVGTSMIASIALGVGLDYAVHLMWHLGHHPQELHAARAGAETGWGICINAAEVAAGFAILSFGVIVPMRNFGALTATAMVVSAIATLALVPAAARLLRLGSTEPQTRRQT